MLGIKVAISGKMARLKRLFVKGEVQQSSDGLKPFLVHIRFSSEGEAIYQRYRLDNQILPLNQKDLDLLRQQGGKT